MNFLSLFTGIGGMDIGLERAGMKCVAQVELDDYCRSILARHWPRVPKFKDIRTFTRARLRARVDLIAGGFPCQDISNAGRKVGITGERSGLWKEMLRLIRSFRPAYVIVENVSALRSRGLNVVLADLAASGFDAEWDCLPAAAFGADHLRDRLFIVAYAKRLGRHGATLLLGVDSFEPAARSPAQDRGLVEIVGRRYRAYPADLRADDGTAAAVDRIRGAGNAVYPPIAEWLGQQIAAFDRGSIGHQRDFKGPRSLGNFAQIRAHLARRAHLANRDSTRRSAFKGARPRQVG